MRVLVFNWRCWLNPAAGGAERFTYEVAKRLVGYGWGVTWFTAKYPNCKREESIDGIHIVRDGGRYSVYRKAKQYYKKYFQGKYDLVLDEINTRPFMTVDYVKDVKIVALIHQLAREFWSYETPLPLSLIGRYYLENRWLRKYCNTPTITVSESTKSDLEQLGFKHIFIVSEGLNIKPVDELPEKNAEPTIIFLGRLKKVKQPEHALKAFKIIKQQIPNIQLWIVGDGPLRKKLEKKAIEGVTIYGRVSEEEKISLLRKAHLLLFPGIREGWGLTVIEAASQGTPTIAYNVPGLRDSVKHMKTGILTPPNQIEQLAQMTIHALLNKKLLYKLSQQALEYSRNFNWDKTAQQVFKILKNL
ncbi:MAG: glycosyltransferase family 4 protein [Candidatus Odinarchaeia archaeon]